jgi:hypothetical protein
VTARPGTSTSAPTSRSTISEYSAVATNVPKQCWLGRSRRNVRSTRGENWVLASCSATIVIENTVPVNAIVEPEMAERTWRALSGPRPNTSQLGTSPPSLLSIATMTTAAAMAPNAHTMGRNHSPVFSHSRSRARRTSWSGERGEGRTDMARRS